MGKHSQRTAAQSINLQPLHGNEPINNQQTTDKENSPQTKPVIQHPRFQQIRKSTDFIISGALACPEIGF
jgi:hypothetical protein